MSTFDPEESSLSRKEVEARRLHQQRLTLDHSVSTDNVSNDLARIRGDIDRRLQLLVLGSGSKGNAAVVFDRVSGDGVLIDAGICKRDVFDFSEQGGFDLKNLKAILISHSHSDHVKNLGVIMRGLRSQGIEAPIYAHELTYEHAREMQKTFDISDLNRIDAGQTIELGSLRVKILPTSHDTEVSFGFRFESGGDALGFITDTGTLLPEALEGLRDVRILGLESNHDEAMLRNGPYPLMLKERVGSDHGHLSNAQAAAALESLISDKLETVVALHISENNNTYRIPVETLRAVVERAGAPIQVTCAYQHRPVFITS
ncbi:MBL fold metallo-hydrolase [Anaerotardibacter muris]|uniref:MBL fold metallo-hydrolase n=1 Tax=Anaerotardibacter muris TaxID=2941505 RepID=UPI00203A54EC|nr:MBL fold metallo-hydrolase [Anaerotardibacter muris]